LYDATFYVEGLKPISPRWSKAAFAGAKDTVNLCFVDRAFSRPGFWDEVMFLNIISGTLKVFMCWGRGCFCHDADRMA
jgi:hypothetical protein